MLSSFNVSCKACAGTREEASTVKIDMDKLVTTSSGKENVAPALEQQKKEDTCMDTCMEKAEKERKLREEAARKRSEQEEAERKRAAAAEAAKRRAMEEEAKRKVEEQQRAEQRRLELEQIEEKRRIAEEQRRQAELERQQREDRERLEEEARLLAEEYKRQHEANKKLSSFLEGAGYTEVNEKKRKAGLIFSSFSYPLHSAVEASDEDAIRILLTGGADRSLTNSKKLTALELARKRNKKGSLFRIIQLLSE